MVNQVLNILLVEDNLLDIQLTRRALVDTDINHQLHVVNHGGQAFSFLFGEGPFVEKPRPDLIFLDLHMPFVDGNEVLHRLKSGDEFSAIPIVMLTALGSEEGVASSTDRLADAYMAKPVDSKQLITFIQAHFPQVRG